MSHMIEGLRSCVIIWGLKVTSNDGIRHSWRIWEWNESGYEFHVMKKRH